MSPQDGVEQSAESYIVPKGNEQYENIYSSYSISNINDSPLFYSGRKTTIKLNNIYYSYLFFDYAGTGKMQYIHEPDSVRARVTYTDNTIDYFDTGVKFSYDGVHTISCEFKFTPEKDVKTVTFTTEVFIYNAVPFTKVTAHLGEISGDGDYSFLIEQSSEEAGLLEGIIGKLTDVWNTLTEGFSNLVSKLGDLWNTLKSVLTSLTTLPTRLWDKLETGLNNFFLPDDAFMETAHEVFDELLADKFGAIYQAVDMCADAVKAITDSDASDTIYFPSATIDVGSGESFTFGGYDVRIVPEGFEWLATSLKTLIGIVCTLAFINGLKKRYEELMEG